MKATQPSFLKTTKADSQVAESSTQTRRKKLLRVVVSITRQMNVA